MQEHPQSADARHALVSCFWGAGSAVSAWLLLIAGLYIADIHHLGSLIDKDVIGVDWWIAARIALVFGIIGFVTGPAVAGSRGNQSD